MDYEQQAQEFLNKTGVTLTVSFLANMPYFSDDKEKRDVFTFVLQRGNKVYTGKFGDSLNNTLNRLLGKHSSAFGCQLVPTQELFKHTRTKNAHQFYEYCKKNYKKLRATPATPKAYDILACLTKYEPGTFANFCAEYGYDTDSRKAFDIYQAVLTEWDGVCTLWNTEERKELAEIQ